MIKTNISQKLFGKEIIVEITKFDIGINIILTGGDVTHIGSISSISQSGQMQIIQFPEHKEVIISNRWAKEIFDILKLPVVVEAGIHYNDATKEQINEILSVTDKLLNEVIKLIIDI